MRHTTDALLVSLVFLLRVERGVFQQVCNHNQCYVVVQEQYDFEGSQKRCLERGGHLLTVQSQDKQKELVRLLRGFTGNYWIGLLLPSDKCPDSASLLRGYRWITGDNKATDFHNWGGFDTDCSSKCVSVSPENNSTWWQESCQNNGLQGFICEYPLVEPCNPLVLKSGEYAEYTTDVRFEDSPSYPPGTTAIKKPSELKYICFSEHWLQAPWSCEVMNGGCEQVCHTYNQQHSCSCASGEALHVNKVSCAKDPCSGCAHHCPKEGDSYACRCNKGYALAEDGKGCVDINECLDRDRCTGESMECVNTEGGFECMCREGFVSEDGKCISVEICDKCEHMKCEKAEGVYKCFCRSGFVVSAKDPTKCEIHCTQQDCLSRCIPDLDPAKEPQCECPGGYIQDIRNGTSICTDIDECDDPRQCDHECRNTYGGYTCSCDEGFDLYDGHQCVASDDGSGSTTPSRVSTPDIIYPTAIPTYVKTGSVLGIVVFVALFMSLLYFLVRRALKRCRKFEISSLRGADVDLFHLQQVTTEKYKRFSFDKQWKNDSQRQ